MKKMKKFFALLVAMVMVLGMSASVFAATITINQDSTADGTLGAETYDLYKIFDVTKTDDVTDPVTTDTSVGTDVTSEGFSYTISTTNNWFDVLGSVGTDGTWSAAEGQEWVTLAKSAGSDTEYNVTWVGGTTEAAAIAFADWLLANKGSIAADETMTSVSGTATKADVDDGYYLITSSLGTNLVLATSDITITTKNEYITDDKTVAKTDWNVGDHVSYSITVNLPASIDYTKPVIVHDTMDDVLAYDNNAAATIDGASFSGLTVVKSEEFGTDHDASHAAADGKVLFDFVLDINSLAPAAGAEPAAKTIVITYTAELLSTAAADGTGFVNEEFTEYSKYKTTPNEVTAKTFDFDLEKEFTGSTESDLEATFNLYGTEFTEDENGTYYLLKSGAYTTTAPITEGEDANADLYADTTKKYSGAKSSTAMELVEETKYEKYVKVDSDDQTKTTTITAKIGTTLNVRGLASGTYYLTEVTTAEGFNLLTEDIVIVIDEEGNVTLSGASELFTVEDNMITVINNSGTVLPSTGGIGTTIFYVVGAILVIGAGVVLVTRRRMNAQ